MEKTLLERLAIAAGMIELGEKIAWGSDSALMREAAAEIERLNAELESIGAGGVSALVPVRNATTAGELTDEQIDAITSEHWGGQLGASLMTHRACIRAGIAADRALRANPPGDAAMPVVAFKWLGNEDVPLVRQADAQAALDVFRENILSKMAIIKSQREEVNQLRADRAQRQAGQEPVLYQYRWLNPDNNPNIGKNETAWLPVEPRNVHTDTVENRVRELWAYRYGGKPVYEVRPLYTARPAAQVPEGSEHAVLVSAIERRLICEQRLKPAQVSLTPEQIEDMRGEANRGFNIEREDYFKAVRDTEAAHGITPPATKGATHE